MSDTPKTDAIAERFGHGPLDPNDAVEQYNDLLDLARQLERALHESGDGDTWRDACKRLERECGEMHVTIRRLTDAITAMNVARDTATINAATAEVTSHAGVPSGPAVAAPCCHPWRGEGPAPKYWWCCGVKVYRSYADYCDD